MKSSPIIWITYASLEIAYGPTFYRDFDERVLGFNGREKIYRDFGNQSNLHCQLIVFSVFVMDFFSELTDILMQPPKFDFNDPKTPFFTSPRFLPPTKMEKCRVC